MASKKDKIVKKLLTKNSFKSTDLNSYLENSDIYLFPESQLHEFAKLWHGYHSNLSNHPNNYFYSHIISIEEEKTNYFRSYICHHHGFWHHGSTFNLLKKDIVVCLEQTQDRHPYLFVKDEFFNSITNEKQFSLYVMIDAIGVKEWLLREGAISIKSLQAFTDKLNRMMKRHKKIKAFSFADTVMLKIDYSTNHNYLGSILLDETISLIEDIINIYETEMGFKAFAIISSGFLIDNFSRKVKYAANLSVLGGLGLPFAKIIDIEKQIKDNIKKKVHQMAELYLDESVYGIFTSIIDKSGISDPHKYGSQIGNKDNKYRLVQSKIYIQDALRKAMNTSFMRKKEL